MSEERFLLSGNHAIAEAAIRVGCKSFYGYPITPQSELLEYMARNLPKRGGRFYQTESEIAAINMMFGEAATGTRTMTSSSGLGISLMTEGFSHLAAAELPCVVVNVSRAGPGLGNIMPSQGDYWQATKGGGHGDFRMIVLGPALVQECADLVFEAFYLADKYRNPVMILTDGATGQMKERVIFKDQEEQSPCEKEWAITIKEDRDRRVVKSQYAEDNLEEHVKKLIFKYEDLASHHTKYELFQIKEAEIVVIAFGICSRVCKGAVKLAREDGIKVGLIRPITLFPFPYQMINDLAKQVRAFLTVEMNFGQMLEDVKIAAQGTRVEFYGRFGGFIPSPKEIFEKIKEINTHL